MKILSMFYENWDLLAVGAVISTTVILGFSVFFRSVRNTTYKTFLGFSLFVALWGTLNYLSYQAFSVANTFITFRFTLFAAIWMSFFFMLFALAFPKEKISLSNIWLWLLGFWTIVVSILTLTPFVLESVSGVSPEGVIVSAINGPAMPVFGITAVGYILVGIVALLIKTIRANKKNRSQFLWVMIGVLIMFISLTTSNFILPVLFNNPSYLPLAALFVFPFIIFTSYDILQYKLFNIKVGVTAFLVVLLAVITFTEVVLAGQDNLSLLLFRSAVFLLVLTFGILLIRSVQKEITQREQLEVLSKELVTANEKLKELDKLKTEFLSFASHQLRSPLTAIKGYTSMLLEGSYGALEEKAKEPVSRVMESSNHLVKLIEDFLNITKIEQGGMKYVFAKTDMEQLLREITQELSVAAEKKGIKLTLTTDGKVGYYANADGEKLRQVLLNFIDNAIKYTPAPPAGGAGGFVKVALEKTPARLDAQGASGGPARKLRISVTDSGIGMDTETQAKLFQKFGRGGEGARVNTGGSGLGLYLAKQIVEAHGGAISATSPGPNQGSTFAIELAMG